MRTDSKITIVQTAVAAKGEARKLAALILAQRLGACVQITPINSLYRWRGKTESAGEFLLVTKTRPARAAKLAAFIRKNHSYELPEIIVIKAEADPGYARWVFKETK